MKMSSGALESLDAFIEKWRASLSEQAQIAFETRMLDDVSGLHSAIADHFAASLGLKSIGANWELLDPSGDEAVPRSAIAAFQEAFAKNMALPGTQWLGESRARECGRDFLGAFDPASRTIVTNRMYFGWHPLTDAQMEWAFIGFDDRAIALLLAVTAD
ncbi:hypothetical protein [Erythrobacter ani]|uniref:SnoaL-like domain-containing protein n=1 Tax=Erythrobacter ani TaxID=2827235 RepID=A0ABS6SJX4_9SPHN|nr:hypothetical protein [Erythrobacter ani]MBV7265325.1 hypothetical protein [Erythrobacter ani]